MLNSHRYLPSGYCNGDCRYRTFSSLQEVLLGSTALRTLKNVRVIPLITEWALDLISRAGGQKVGPDLSSGRKGIKIFKVEFFTGSSITL